MLYTVIIYEYGNGIFNTDKSLPKYRTGVNEIIRINFTNDDVYENKKISSVLLYLVRDDGTHLPMINLCFASHNSLKRYIKDNKAMLENNYGKLGTDYYIEDVLFSHNDTRTI